MRAVVCLAFVLAACTFDGSGTEYDEPGGADAQDVDAAAPDPIDAAPPPPPVDASLPSVDGGNGWHCDLDGQCDPNEDQDCIDCWGDFVCDFDRACEQGESDECLDCLGSP